jgi:2-amino-4-hydroxy-6-hydroxymethyldihydropteridine diphosphokinase
MHTAFIALGGNLTSPVGSPEATLAAAALRLQSIGRVLSRSSLYSTEPVGFSEQPRFLNAVLALETELSPRALLTALLAIEHEFGRDRSAGIANGPRTLDLDILLYDDLILDEPDLMIPHPRLAERAFVLVPLAEIAPETIEPRSKSTVIELLHRPGEESPSQSAAVVPVQGLLWTPQDFVRATRASKIEQ